MSLMAYEGLVRGAGGAKDMAKDYQVRYQRLVRGYRDQQDTGKEYQVPYQGRVRRIWI